jgi:hypothetical protein
VSKCWDISGDAPSKMQFLPVLPDCPGGQDDQGIEACPSFLEDPFFIIAPPISYVAIRRL